MAEVSLFSVAEDLKRCSKCGFPAAVFRAKRNLCKKCHQEYHQQYYKDNKDRFRLNSRQNHLKRKYQISTEEFQALSEKQGGRCAICHQPPDCGRYHKTLHVDHCHSTGEVRGLLCWNCNTSIGKFDDDPEMLRRALAYLCPDGGKV